MSRVHYFQQYQQKENVVTNNTLLLFSRLFRLSTVRFEDFLNSLLGEEIDRIEVGVSFAQQEGNRSGKSIPDGEIKQSSLKLLIETKLYDNQHHDQLVRHLHGFEKNEDQQVLMLINPSETKESFDNQVRLEVNKYNKDKNQNVSYLSITFDNIIKTLDSVLFDYDFELREMLEEYREFCSSANLIPRDKFMMRAIVSSKSYKDNLKFGIYYDPLTRGYTKHSYIGLYRNKSIRAIGKLDKVVYADYDLEHQKFSKIILKEGEVLTELDKTNIINIMAAAKTNNGWNIYNHHQFFIVEEFHETDYKKTTKYPLQRTKFFDLGDILQTDKLPECSDIAFKLRGTNWDDK